MYSGKVQRDVGGAHIDGVPITEQQANAMGQGLPIDSSAYNGDSAVGDISFYPGILKAWGATLFIACLLGNNPDSGNSPNNTQTVPNNSGHSSQAARANSSPLQMGYYRARNAVAPAAIASQDQALKITFSQRVCVIVTNPSPLFGNDIVEISIPNPGGPRITAMTHRSQLVPARDCP